MAETYSISKKEKAKCVRLLKKLKIKIDGKPAHEAITEGQLWILHALIFKPSNRIHIMTSTQYGKSRIVAIACAILSCIFDEMVAVVAPTNEKAKIIMRYYVEHMADSPVFSKQLDPKTKLERLQQEESKQRIKLLDGGGIYIVSVQAGNVKKQIEGAMGYGAKNVILDEACLVPDDSEATVFRMIAGQADGFYCKIGNPFYAEPPNSHFLTSYKDPNYLKIFINYEQGLKEGRYNTAFIEEARKKPLFDILFECKFPTEGQADKKGWFPLLTHQEVETAMEGASTFASFGERAMGIDPSEGNGGDEASIIIRSANLAKVEYGDRHTNPLNLGGQGILLMRANPDIKAGNVMIDKIGLGTGTVNAFHEQGLSVSAVNVAETPMDKKNFVNKKAEAYWRLRMWIKNGGKLYPDERWFELCNVKFRAVERTGRMEIMSKQEMRGRGIASPNVAEALMLTFVTPLQIKDPGFEDRFFKTKMRIKEQKLKAELRALRHR